MRDSVTMGDLTYSAWSWKTRELEERVARLEAYIDMVSERLRDADDAAALRRELEYVYQYAPQLDPDPARRKRNLDALAQG